MSSGDKDEYEPHPSESLEIPTVPPYISGSGRAHPSEADNFDFITVPAHVVGNILPSPSHPSEHLEFATIAPVVTAICETLRPRSRNERLDLVATLTLPSNDNTSSRPHSPKRQVFAREPLALTTRNSSSKPHPSELLEFATIAPTVSNTIYASQPHPSELLEFATVSPVLTNNDLVPQRSPIEAVDFATSRYAGDSDRIRSLSSGADFSSIISKPNAAYYEYAAESSERSNSNNSGDKERRKRPQLIEPGGGGRVGRTNSVNELILRLTHGLPGFTLADSNNAAIAERKMSLSEGLRLYPKAIGWCLMLSATLIMEGYDLSIINGFYVFPAFKKRYGTKLPSGSWQLSTAWQTGLTNGAVIGEILGLFANGILTERFGYRRCLISALLFLCASIFLAFFSYHISMLMASEVLCGLAWGVFQTLGVTYAGEVMPMALRAYLTSNINLCWLIGQVIGLSVLRGTITWKNDWSYRLPFALQWMWAVPILVGTYLAPDSPWWLVRHERFEDAKKALIRLTSRNRNSDFSPDETIALMRHTNEIEKHMTAGTTYWDCFKGHELRRTEIVCMVWMIQTLAGGPMASYAAYFFNEAGFSATKSFDLSAGMYGLAIVAHFTALVLMNFVGRRRLYIFGCCAMCVTLLLAGSVGSLPTTPARLWTLGALVIMVTFFYDLTVGPVCYSLVAEIPSTRLRVKTVVLGRVAYNITSVIANIFMSQMLNPESWNLKGKTCFLWAGTAFFSTIWCYYRLPEPKGLTYMELDILFSKKAPTKKFKKVRLNLQESGYFELVDRKDEGQRWDGT